MKHCELSESGPIPQPETGDKSQLLKGLAQLLRDGLGGKSAVVFHLEQNGAVRRLGAAAPEPQTQWMGAFLRAPEPLLLRMAQAGDAWEAACALDGQTLVLVQGLQGKPDAPRCAAARTLLAGLRAQWRQNLAAAAAQGLRPPLFVALEAADMLKANVRQAASGRYGAEYAETFSFLEQSLYQELCLAEKLVQLQSELPQAREILDLRDVTRRAVHAARPYACLNGVAVEWRDEVGRPLLGTGRTDWWEQIVLGLLAGAVGRCAETGGAVTVTLAAEPAVLTLTVQDNGGGLQTAVPYLLEAAGDEKNTGQKGAELGLCLVRRLAEALGGAVQAQNAASGGAVFTVQVPLPPPLGPQEEQLHAPVRAGGDTAERAKMEFSVLDRWQAEQEELL